MTCRREPRAPPSPRRSIIGSNVPTKGGDYDQHSPLFYESASFFFTFSKLPTTLTYNDIKSVNFGFGTQPESPLSSNPGTPQGPASTPEPGTLALASIGLASIGWVKARRRRQAA